MKTRLKKHSYLKVTLLAVLLSVTLSSSNGFAQQISAEAIRAHTGFLADDQLEGRGTATRGEALASLYLTSELREYSLQPVTDKTADYRIPVPLTAYNFDTSEMHIRVQSVDSNYVLNHPDFYHPGGAPVSFKDFSGDLLFAGPTPHALSALEKFNDLTGFVVVLGPPWEGVAEVEEELKHRSAEGAIEVVPNAFYERLRVVRGPTRYALPDEADDPSNQSELPMVIVGPSGAEALGLLQRIKSQDNTKIAEDLNTRIKTNFSIASEAKTGYNVAALLPGTDSALSDSIVMFTAHYDHVGFGEPTKGDSIWNGFVDNATGSSILLELARVLAADPPSHPVLFLFTTAEEQGLLGATWFAQKEPVSLDRIQAVINIDGGAPPADIKNWTVAGSDKYELRKKAVNILEANDWDVESKPIISDSDHWPFHRAGVPALFLYPGSQADSEHIHTAKDEWQADFPFDGLKHYAEVALLINSALEKQ